MTDKERLIKFLAESDTDDGIPASMCEQCMLEWLKQPAEVDDG